MIFIKRRPGEELLFIMKCLGNHSSQVRTRMLGLFDSPQSAAFQRCRGKIFYPRCLTFKHHDDHHEERLLFIMKCFCNRSSQVWTRMLAMEIWKWAFPTKSRWSSMISVAPGVERYLLIYWPVQLQVARFGWFGGGVTIWCLVMRTYSKLAKGLEVWKKIHITRAKPLTHCFFSSERAQLAGGSRWYRAQAPVVVISNYNNCHLSHLSHHRYQQLQQLSS